MEQPKPAAVQPMGQHHMVLIIAMKHDGRATGKKKPASDGRLKAREDNARKGGR